MSRSIKPFLLGIALSATAWLLLFFKGCFPQRENYVTTTDTIFIDKPYKELVIKEVVRPQKVYVYKTDTIIRKIIEKDTLVSSLELTPKKAKIHIITPKGVPMIKEYPLVDYRRIQIDHEGNLGIRKVKHPKRRKLLKTLGKVGIFVGGFLVGKEVAK